MHNQANIIAVLGGSGSGKSRSVKEQLLKIKPSRLMIWDMLHEYGAHAKMTDDLNKVIDTLSLAGKSKPFAISFNAEIENKKKRAEQFHTICGLARAAGGVTFVVDELKFVTSAQFAPDRWSAVSSIGRHAGMTLIGMSQRPAQIDKDFLGNCTVIRTFRLGYPDDQATVARAMNLPVKQVAALQEFEFISKNLLSGEVTTGKMPW